MREATHAVVFRASFFRAYQTLGLGVCCETIGHCSNDLFRYETVTMGCDETIGHHSEVEGAKRPMPSCELRVSSRVTNGAKYCDHSTPSTHSSGTQKTSAISFGAKKPQPLRFEMRCCTQLALAIHLS